MGLGLWQGPKEGAGWNWGAAGDLSHSTFATGLCVPVLVFPGQLPSSPCPRAGKALLSTPEVLAHNLAAPGLPYLQSLQSLGAFRTWWAAGRALVGRNSRVGLRKAPELAEMCWKDGLPRHSQAVR